MTRYVAYMVPVLLLLIFSPASKGTSGEDAPVTLEMAGLSDEVEIWRDPFGVPHIRAGNENDLFFAFGYVTAADRLFQLDGARRVALGKVSELFGAKWLNMDIMNRDIGYRYIAEEMYQNISPKARESLGRYTDGINHYIETHRGKFPLEFLFLGYEPDLWKETDSLAIMRMFSWWLSADRNQERLRTYFSQYYNDEIAVALFPSVPPGSESALPGPIPEAEHNRFGESRDFPLDRISPVNGSNCWVVGPGKTRDGYAILAADPHVELFAPSSWYQVHLTGGSIDAIGVCFPGVPAIPIGHNERVSWGASNMPYDIQDYTLLKIDPNDTNRYRWGDEWLEFEVNQEEILYKNGDGVEINSHRRLVSEAGFVVHKGMEYLALRWTGSEPNDDLTPLMDLIYMESAEDISSVLSSFNCAPQSFIAADVEGHISQVFAGRVPLRDGYSGLTSSKGAEKPQWTGMLETNDLPFIIDPPLGYIAHANNLPEYCTVTARGSFKAPYIYQRINELLGANERIDIEFIREMQMDVVSLFAKVYVGYINEIAQGVDHPTENVSLAFELLADWDYSETEDSSEATLFHEWFVIFTEEIFTEAISPASYKYYEDYTHAMDIILKQLLNGEANPVLFPDLTAEDVREAAINALDEAVVQLNERYGEGPEKWPWGKVHRTQFNHPSGVEFLLGAGEYPDRGSRYTIKVADFFNQERYISTFGVSYRQIIEMRPDDVRGWWILPPGNHGATLSPHYRDQIQMWRKGELARMWFYKDDIEANCSLAAVLKPTGGGQGE